MPRPFFLAAFLALGCLLSAEPLTFEVATVKPSTSGINGVRGGCHGIDSNYSPAQLATATPLGRCVVTDGRLSHFIAMAWNQAVTRIQNAPDWVIAGSERFNIQAEAENPQTTTEAQLHEMLQTLLIDRVHLKFHNETKDMPGYALVVAKNGPRLQDAKGDEVTLSFGAVLKPVPGQPITMTAHKYSIGMLVGLLSKIDPGAMVDATGLTGAYDFQLAWDENAGPTIFTALQEQLGLKLEPRKVPVAYFVIDSAQRPGDN